MKSETNRRGADHPGRQTGPSRKDTKRGGWSQEEKPRQRPARPATAEDVRAGDDIVVTVKRIGINGEGVGYYKRKAVFVDGVLPGEVVKAKVAKVEPGYLQAAAIKIEKKSPERQEPPCPVYASCGGCQLQHMTYEAQLRAKEEIVREAFQRYAGIDRLPLRPILGMDDPWGYRNKAQLQAGRGESGLVAGLYSLGTRQLVDISGCAVHDPRLNEAVERTKRVLEELDLPVYEEKKRQGIVKTIAVRVSRRTGKLQLTLVTAGDRFPDARRFVQAVRRELPQVGSISHNIHKGGSPLVFGDKTVHLWGEDKLEETLGGLRFSLSPRAFFQLNPEQTVKLYGAVQEAAALSGGELVVDAYCGTGTIGLWLASGAREVRGIELLPEAVLDARDNARASGIDNARFYEGRAEELLPEWVRQGVRPDVVVVDPPRTGCGRELLDAVLTARPQRLVYVSCNPATLAKDAKALLAGGYRLEWAQPVDMFPQTSHVECCVLFSKR
ncbi:23S rRNA (uracil(1939)-C(5))-methyltransferase RlmD [Paenibacillus albicereus]|nr:23S rRNA (uracil(1939)-C(5))-methyltransferase RlmD [Paenibacillus albicereus]